MSGRAFVTTMAVIVDGMEYTARAQLSVTASPGRCLMYPISTA